MSDGFNSAANNHARVSHNLLVFVLLSLLIAELPLVGKFWLYNEAAAVCAITGSFIPWLYWAHAVDKMRQQLVPQGACWSVYLLCVCIGVLAEAGVMLIYYFAGAPSWHIHLSDFSMKDFALFEGLPAVSIIFGGIGSYGIMSSFASHLRSRKLFVFTTLLTLAGVIIPPLTIALALEGAIGLWFPARGVGYILLLIAQALASRAINKNHMLSSKGTG